jgi:hypothetical protein
VDELDVTCSTHGECCKIFVGVKFEGERLLPSARRRWEDLLKIHLNEMRLEDGEWIQ